MGQNTRGLSLKRLLPRRWQRWTFWAVVIYAVLGFLVLPPIVRRVAQNKISTQIDREVSIRSVRINPFALSATVRGLLIKDKDGEPLMSWDEFYANFQLLSLVTKPWVFREIRLVNPYARVQVNKDYSLNISDILQKLSQSEATPAEPPKPIALRVGRLQISGARASFADLTPRTPFHRVIGPVEVTLTKFHTDPTSENPYAFSGTTDSGEKFSWSGYFSLDPIRSGGRVQLEGLSIPKYAALYQDFVQFEIRDGVIDARSEYRFAFVQTNMMAVVSNAAFTLKSFKAGEPGVLENFAELDNFSVSNVNADAQARVAEVGNVFLDGARIALKRDQSAALNVIELSRPPADATNAPGGILFLLNAATNAFAALIQSTNLWSGTLHELTVTNCAFNWHDELNSRPVDVTVDEIAVTAKNLSNVPGANQTASVALRWNTNGSVRVETVAQLSPPSADVTLAVHDLELHPLDPYLEPFLNLFIIGSKVGLNGQLQMRMASNDLPSVTFQGNATLDDFASLDGVMAEDLVKWKSVRFTGIDATLTPPTVAVKEVSLIEPYARIAVETNNTLNLLAALRIGTSNSVPTETNFVATKPETEKASKRGGIGRRLGGLLRETLTANTNANAALPAITIDAVAISNAAVQFNDRSLTPPVSATVEEINGTIGSLSSTDLRRADVHLTAKANRTGPIEIKGHINPLNQSAPTELHATMRNIDLSPASPYAARFLGYRLNRGKLNLAVNYEISERKLTATNMVELDQLTLGQRVNSPDATKLPVKLALIILKDSDDKIKLDVPIEGSLDDPQFRLGKVIAQTIANIITKLVASPFTALGGLFGGRGDEISFQEFIPGSAELQTNNLEKIEMLLAGLEKQPALELGIEGGYDPAADRDALRRQKLERQWQQQKWSTLRKTAQTRMTPEEVTLTDEERAENLQKLYETIAAEKQLPEAETVKAPAKTATDSKGAEVLVRRLAAPSPSVPVSDMERVVLDTINVSDDELRNLATQRAQRVRDKILESGRIAAERIYMLDVQSPGPSNAASRVYFHLQ